MQSYIMRVSLADGVVDGVAYWRIMQNTRCNYIIIIIILIVMIMRGPLADGVVDGVAY